MKKTLGRCRFWVPVLIALAGLSGLALVRIWAVLGGRLPGKLMLILALALAVLCLFLVVRFRLVTRFLLPWGLGWKTALLAVPAFVLGALFDTSLAMFHTDGLLISTPPFRMLSALGSGLVFAAIVLALVKAARDWGPLDCPCGRMMLILALAVNVLTAVYYAGSATVYTWDVAIYWNSSTLLAGQPLDLAQIRLVLESVITQEYNYLMSWPISLVMRVLGTGRYVYLFSVVNLYVLPCLWGMCVLGRRTRHGGLLLALTTPMLLYIALVGFADVAAAGLGIWAFVLYTDERRPELPRGILAGALLVGTFLLRRYFFFFAVSFGVAALLALVVRRRQWRAFAALFCSTAVCSLFFTQSFLVEKVLSTRYGDIYSAYNQGRVVDVMMFTRYFGIMLLTVAVAAGILLLLCRPDDREGAVLALCQLVVCVLLFTRIQSHGQQHLLLYLPGLCWLLARGLDGLPHTRPAAVCAAALAVCTAVSPFLPRPQPASQLEIQRATLLPSFSYAPPRREDIAQLISLRTYVDNLSAQSPKTVAVVSSSLLLNDNTYTNILRSMNIPQPPDSPATQVIYMATVDKRDAFSWNVLTADYLLVGDPVQTHLGIENQQIMAVLAEAVLSGQGVGSAYRPLTSFSLEHGVTARIYERVRDVRPDEYRAISQSLCALYPDYADQYQPPAWTVKAP